MKNSENRGMLSLRLCQPFCEGLRRLEMTSVCPFTKFIYCKGIVFSLGIVILDKGLRCSSFHSAPLLWWNLFFCVDRVYPEIPRWAAP